MSELPKILFELLAVKFKAYGRLAVSIKSSAHFLVVYSNEKTPLAVACSNNCIPLFQLSLDTDSLPVSSGTPGAKDFPQSPCCVQARKGCRSKHFLQGHKPLRACTSSTNFGKSLEAGLPNITGQTIALKTRVPSPFAEGAFYLTAVNIALNAETGYVDCTEDLHIDASRCSVLYGNSTTVMPASINSPCIIYLGK